MLKIKDLNILDSNHHAFLILGDPVVLVDELKNSLPANTVDVWCEFFDDLSIDDSKKIKAWQTTKPIALPLKYGLWGIGSANMEAQNALLKVLEEPATDVKMILVVPHEGILLPTVLSRLLIIKLKQLESNDETIKLAKKFLMAEPYQRLELLQKNFKYDDNAIKSQILNFLSACEQVVQESFNTNEKQNIDFSELVKAKKNISDRSAVPRLVLEYVATVL